MSSLLLSICSLDASRVSCKPLQPLEVETGEVVVKHDLEIITLTTLHTTLPTLHINDRIQIKNSIKSCTKSQMSRWTFLLSAFLGLVFGISWQILRLK